MLKLQLAEAKNYNYSKRNWQMEWECFSKIEWVSNCSTYKYIIFIKTIVKIQKQTSAGAARGGGSRGKVFPELQTKSFMDNLWLYFLFLFTVDLRGWVL